MPTSEDEAYDRGYRDANERVRAANRELFEDIRRTLYAERARTRRRELLLRWRRTEIPRDYGCEVPVVERVVENDRLGYRWLRWLRYGERLATDDCEMNEMEMHGPRSPLP